MSLTKYTSEPKVGRSVHIAKYQSAMLGVASGVVASLVMNEVASLFLGKDKRPKGYERQSGGQKQKPKGTDQPATLQLAEKASLAISGNHLSKDEKKIYGPLFHLLFGAALGAAYALTKKDDDDSVLQSGLVFGAGTWLLADETAMPLLGLSKSPTEYPVKSHVVSFLGHLTFGVTTSLSVRLLKLIYINDSLASPVQSESRRLAA